jgi:hypothetical protein
LRTAGTSEYIALLAATVISGLKVGHDAIRARRLDPFAGYLLLTFGLSLAVGLSTTDPRTVLVGNTVVNGIGGVLFLVSCVVGVPLTQVVAERVHPPEDDHESASDPAVRRLHILLSAMWGIGLLAEVAVRLRVISRVSVDVANGATTVISLTTVGVLIAATVVVSARVRARREQTAYAEG